MDAKRIPRTGTRKMECQRNEQGRWLKKDIYTLEKRTVEETNVYFAGSLRKNKGTVSKDKAKQELELKQDIVLDRNIYNRLVNIISND